MITQTTVNQIAYEIVGAAIEVHKHLGPGMLESIYEMCLLDELRWKNLSVESQILLPIVYKGRDLGNGLRIDLLVENVVIVELKAVEVLHPVFKAQLLSYLKMSGKPKGLLINFHCENIKNSLIPLVTDVFAGLPK